MVNKGKRIVNYVIDLLAVTIVSAICQFIFCRDPFGANLLTGLIYFLYYFIFESINGKTLGKMLTKTVVRDLKQKKAGLFKIFIRSILRLNPFDIASYLFGEMQGTHYVLSRTRLFEDVELKK